MELDKKEIIEEVKLKEGDLEAIYKKIKEVLRKYCDIQEEYYDIIALWIIGTWFHDAFLTYPYLFFNASKGSGKTRILKLIAELSKNGQLLVNMTEAVLFRTAKNRTLCIDEFERIGSKEKTALRELLNAAYKKGIRVERAYKVRGKDKEEIQVESFEVFCPIAIANIWGMEDVLGDRCISLILERSSRKEITKKMELFEFDPDIQEIKRTFSNKLFGLGEGCEVKDAISNIYIHYNNYNSFTPSLLSLPSFLHFPSLPSLLKKSIESSLDGRQLELFFPLFIIASMISEETLDRIIRIAEKMTEERKEDEFTENKDVSLLDFIANELNETKDFIPIRDITMQFREKFDEADWINSEWIGRALKRLKLIIQKRRIGRRGVEVILNFSKAREKIKIFKPEEEKKMNITINIENLQQNIFQTKHLFKVIKPIDLIILKNDEPFNLKAMIGQFLSSAEFNNEILNTLLEEGYIEPIEE